MFPVRVRIFFRLSNVQFPIDVANAACVQRVGAKRPAETGEPRFRIRLRMNIDGKAIQILSWVADERIRFNTFGVLMAPVPFEECPEDDFFARKGSDRHGSEFPG